MRRSLRDNDRHLPGKQIQEPAHDPAAAILFPPCLHMGLAPAGPPRSSLCESSRAAAPPSGQCPRPPGGSRRLPGEREIRRSARSGTARPCASAAGRSSPRRPGSSQNCPPRPWMASYGWAGAASRSFRASSASSCPRTPSGGRSSTWSSNCPMRRVPSRHAPSASRISSPRPNGLSSWPSPSSVSRIAKSSKTNWMRSFGPEGKA